MRQIRNAFNLVWVILILVILYFGKLKNSKHYIFLKCFPYN